MRDLLNRYYAIPIKQDIALDGRNGFTDGEYVYFTISADNKEAIYMEQATLAYYLVENGFEQTAFPIQNQQEQWITYDEGTYFLVVKARQVQTERLQSHGKSLASFHQANVGYPYEPQYISSYGQWKQLWIDKLTFYEERIIAEAKENSNESFRLLMDSLPYIIGISENAIQYIQESERESKFNEGDQGTITFQRYRDDMLKSVIWMDDLVYDHPIRDVAEFIRLSMTQKNPMELEEVWLFLKDYDSIRPLSNFSWRLLYARLLFPANLFDFIESGLIANDMDRKCKEMTEVLEKQSIYEENIRSLFLKIRDHFAGDIPVLQWL